MSLRPLDLANIIFPGAPAVNPCNPDLMALAQSRMDIQKDTYSSRLILMNLNTGEIQQLDLNNTGANYDHSPRWSPDGNSLAFLRRIQGMDELWLYDLSRETAYSLTPNTNVKDYVWSPRGDKIAFVSRIREINDIFYRVRRIRYKLDGEGITNGYNHIFVIDLKGLTKTQISTGESDHSCPCFNGTGEVLIYVKEFPHKNDVYKHPKIGFYDFAQGISGIWDPEAYSISALICGDEDIFYGVGKRTTEHSSELDKILVFKEGQPALWLTDPMDISIGCYVASDAKRTGLNSLFTGSRDFKRIIFIGTRNGKQSVFIFETQSSKIIEIPWEANVLAFDLLSCDADSCQLVCLADSINQPGEIFRLQWDYLNPVQVEKITSFNDKITAHWPKVETKEFKLPTVDGLKIQGWLMQKANIDTPENKGAILIIHGGPYLSFGKGFYFDFVYLSSLGYAVIFCNPRGSAGYGQTFARAILGEWGRGDVQDILGFLDLVCQECRWAGPLFVMGGSYGGYLVNWLISHDHRFSGAISERALCNLYSKIGNSDLGFIDNRAQLGWADLWDDEEFIMESSPIRYAREVNTPVLLMHGEQDQRVPIEQAEQWYNALYRLGKKVEFIRFPGASHTMATQGRPKQRMARLKIIADWLSSQSN